MALNIIRDDIANVAMGISDHPSAEVVIVPDDVRLSAGGGSSLRICEAEGEESYRQKLQEALGQSSCNAALAPGEAAAIQVDNLACDWTIHATLIPYEPKQNAQPSASYHEEALAVLSRSYDTALNLAASLTSDSVAVTLMGAGYYGFPAAAALAVAKARILSFLADHPDLLVTLVVYDEKATQAANASVGYVPSYMQEATEVAQPRSFITPSMVPLGAAIPCGSARTAAPIFYEEMAVPAAVSDSLDDYLAMADKPFNEFLFDLIDQRHLKDSEVYTRANISRQVFSKIRNRSDYFPKKPTVLALAMALELDLDETRELLSRAGYAFNHTQKFDLVVEYYIAHGKYDLFDLNYELSGMDLPLLGAF